MSGARRSRPRRPAAGRATSWLTLTWQFVARHLKKIVFALLVPTVLGLWTIWFADADIVYVGDKPPPLIGMQSQWKEDKFVSHFAVEPLFMNKGFKPSHIENVRVAPLGLGPYPDKVEVIYVDRRALWWHKKRNIRCDIVVTINRKDVILDGPTLELQFSYHDAGGNQIYWHTEEMKFYSKLPPGGRLVEPPPFKR